MESSFSFGFANDDIEGEELEEVSGLSLLGEDTKMDVEESRGLAKPCIRTLEEMVGSTIF